MNLGCRHKLIFCSGPMIIAYLMMYYAALITPADARIVLDPKVDSNFKACIAKPGFQDLYLHLENSKHIVQIVPEADGVWNGETFPDPEGYEDATVPGAGTNSLIKWRHKGQGPPVPWSCGNDKTGEPIQCPGPGPWLIVEDTDRCATLFHEMTHARMNAEGRDHSEFYKVFGTKEGDLFPRRHDQLKSLSCKYVNAKGETEELTTPFNEVAATQAENEYRRLNGLPERCCYGPGYPLPPNGEKCEEPEKWRKPRTPETEKHPLEIPQRSKVPEKPTPKKATHGPSEPSGGGRPGDMCSLRHCSAASMLGDPHLDTLDGVIYDFQAAGEFTALRSDTGDLIVQVRQVPWRDSRWVSVNHAIAVKLNEDRLTVEYSQDSLTLRINGTSTTLRARKDLPSGGFVMPHEHGYLIGWSDGSLLRVLPNVWGADTSLYLAPERAGTVHGLLGPFTNQRGEMLETKDGKPIGKDGITDYQKLYRIFGDSWRISQAESLFDYASGTSTMTYQKRDFPDPNPPKLASAAETSARELCLRAGVQERALAGCILDVAITGEAGFATTTAAAMRPPASIPTTSDQIFSINIGDHVAPDKPGKGAGRIEIAGARDRYTFTAAPGTLVYLKGESPCTNKALRWGVLDAQDTWVTYLSDLHEICSDTDIGRLLLKTGGSYTIVVRGDKEETGDYGFTIQPVEDGRKHSTGVSGRVMASGTLACTKDQGDPDGTSGRDLNGYMWSDAGMTNLKCQNSCASRGFVFAGTQYGRYCFCGNRYGRFGPSTNCNRVCSGDNAEICGGSWANSISRSGAEPRSPSSELVK